MEFEEFFKKKRIDLAALQKVLPALFSEFETHYKQMGEKSFDHTKKYWFNKLRRQFPLAVEAKTEKPHIANPLAGQTVTDSLTETIPAPAPSPKLGFVPKFKMGNMPKPAAAESKKEDEPQQPAADTIPQESPADRTVTKPAYQPRFKMKPKAETEENPPVTDSGPAPTEDAEAKPAYKPRFNIKTIPPKA